MNQDTGGWFTVDIYENLFYFYQDGNPFSDWPTMLYQEINYSNGY